ncbi:TetR/AcrR family transcriptional regulator [Streptomyces sp. NPDC055037]
MNTPPPIGVHTPPPLGRRAGGRHGRQSEARRNDLLVLSAARAVFAEQGPDAPVSAVAERAGVGVGTLYRRYGSKVQLVQRLCAVAIALTIDALREATEDESGGWESLARYVGRAVDERAGAFASLAGTFPVTPEVASHNEEARELLERLMRKGYDDGSVREDVTALDITHTIELFSRYPRRTDEDRLAQRRMLAIALDGLRPGSPELPGPRPEWDDYHRTWDHG